MSLSNYVGRSTTSANYAFFSNLSMTQVIHRSMCAPPVLCKLYNLLSLRLSTKYSHLVVFATVAVCIDWLGLDALFEGKKEGERKGKLW